MERCSNYYVHEKIIRDERGNYVVASIVAIHIDYAKFHSFLPSNYSMLTHPFPVFFTFSLFLS